MLPETTPVRGRFAPTPSGRLHLGNAATALLAWLQIRAGGGTMALRMEDLDKPRCRPESAAAIAEELRWLGLDWDEGPDIGGPFGPYAQSERLDRYARALDDLGRQGLLYPCYCSRADLLSAPSAPHGLASEGPAYAGACRRLTAAEREARAAVKTPSLRFALPADRSFPFEDGIAGPVRYPPGAGGDFVVKRADGIVGYQLAVVADDIAMGVTDVLRGWDLLDSTPRQLALYEAFGAMPPRFAHAPLLLGPDGGRLSKRHGSVTLSGLRELGVGSRRLVGYLAWLTGLTDRPEPASPGELVAGFDFARIAHESVRLPDDWVSALTAART
ncbi:tRNA glutamyl-Q(34) synthetase GluQRS [Cohnella nanjingensis]|uniref:Glutamyl-Q tRNA(Asp) synthetase n=1 Tax=Cohnella nanjingensis TaxID=1387779 RepID=A0A7X0RKT9_9BACL|nr:tRNA glutamyl-Q(34) synthetase GluQRS [Cohnella nanjingensis]MBB6669275.1 tRNA glutamyl-Q(34) synthetase GluQRS [Cohnella nanjingensis]